MFEWAALIAAIGILLIGMSRFFMAGAAVKFMDIYESAIGTMMGLAKQMVQHEIKRGKGNDKVPDYLPDDQRFSDLE